jgi:hypothetical protein
LHRLELDVAQNQSAKPPQGVGSEPQGASLGAGQNQSFLVAKSQGSNLSSTGGQVLIGPGVISGSGIKTQKAESTESYSPDDEISTFFKNRRIATQSSLGTNIFVKMFLIALGISLALVGSWNYSKVARSNAQKYIFQFTKYDVTMRMPAWTKQAQAFRRMALRQEAEGYLIQDVAGAPNGALGAPMDPVVSLVIEGAWPTVEAYSAEKCPKWTVSHSCAVRAWHLSYRGMRPSLRAVQALDLAPKAGFSNKDRALFLFAKSVSFEGPASDSLYTEAMTAAAGDKPLRRMFFDARFKSLLRSNRTDEIRQMIKIVPELGALDWEISKWRALEISSRIFNPNVLADTQAKGPLMAKLQSDIVKIKPSLARDPVGFLMLAGTMLRLGMAKPAAAIADEFYGAAKAKAVDPSLLSDISNIYSRAMLLDGEAPAALERLISRQKQRSLDGAGKHLLASIYLARKNAGLINEAAGLFREAIQTGDSWQSQAGLLLALTRSGKLSEANGVATRLQRLRTPGNGVWVTAAVSEFKIALAKRSGGMARAKYSEVAGSLAGLYQQYPGWPALAGLYADALANSGNGAEAQKIRLKIDDILSKTSYFSSPEYLASPFGPLALMR